MKGIAALSVALSATAVLAALPEVTVKGNAFFTGSSRFYMRGVDYQPGGSSKVDDPIADIKSCKRDIEEFKKLGINTIRIYSVDNSQNHDECMKALDDAGIYLVLDVNTPKYSLNRNEPEISYNDVYLQNVFATVDAFAKYTNTLAFFSGNEVINAPNNTNCAPYVKAVTRDIRQYIGSRGYRKIPVGYSAADVSENRKEMAEYMNCGTDDERSDFFAFNDYSWCDPSDFQTSGWDKKVENFTGYGIPLFLSEYGCNTNTRKFGEVKSLYSSDTSAVYSGGLVYEYTEEGSKYGLVEISGDSVKELPDFEALQKAFADTPNPTGDGGYSASGGASKCPAASTNWEVKENGLPAIPEPAKKFMSQGAGTGVGLSGVGSQFGGVGSTGTASAGSGQVTATAAGAQSTKKGAASNVQAGDMSIARFAVCGAVVLGSTLFGAALL
ncbi:MAG: beta-glucanosyltransferase [Thelocarpon impressellum]|nr:MAG: beta-glucanosyltransferase [Thelocarpon impressellum]